MSWDSVKGLYTIEYAAPVESYLTTRTMNRGKGFGGCEPELESLTRDSRFSGGGTVLRRRELSGKRCGQYTVFVRNRLLLKFRSFSSYSIRWGGTLIQEIWVEAKGCLHRYDSALNSGLFGPSKTN